MIKTKFIVATLLAIAIGGALVYTLMSKPQAPAASFTGGRSWRLEDSVMA